MAPVKAADHTNMPYLPHSHIPSTSHCILLQHYRLDTPYINKGKMSNPKF
nr:MAG TPA: hypothetical protein [Caudoviricetes sp.]